MASPSSISFMGSISHLISENTDSLIISSVKTKLSLAANTTNREEKKAYFDAAFEVLVTNPKCGIAGVDSETNLLLFNLLNQFAEYNLYAKVENGDREWGFNKSAQLSLVILGLQVQILTGKQYVDLSSLTTIDELMTRHNTVSENLPEITRLLQDKFNSCLSNVPSIEWSKNVSLTVMRLAFSYQNITGFNEGTTKNQALHIQLNDLARALMKPLPDILFEFEYNRCVFTINLFTPHDFQAKLDALDTILVMYKNHYPPRSYEYESKFAQILNMKARVLAPINPQLSNQYSQEAYKVRVGITPPADKELRKSHFFLLNNIHAGLLGDFIDSLKMCPASLMPSIRPVFIKDVLPIAMIMENFIARCAQDGIKENYFEQQKNRINEAKVLAQVMQVTQPEIDAISAQISKQVWY